MLALLALSGEATAEDEAARADARALFAAGIVHAQHGDWREALRAFERGYALAREPALLFNLAGAQLRTGKMLAAASSYTRFMHLSDRQITSAHRRAAARQLAYIEERIPRLRVSVTRLAADDRLTIDGQRIYEGELALEHWVDPGAHEIVLYRANGQTESHRIVLAEGEHRVLPITLP